MVPVEGLEPPCLAAIDFESIASAIPPHGRQSATKHSDFDGHDPFGRLDIDRSGSRPARLLHAAIAKLKAEFAARFSLLDEGFEPRQGLIPLAGDAFEVSLDVAQRLRPELEQAFAPDARAIRDAGAFEHA